MNVVLDSSALIALLVMECGADVVLENLENPTTVCYAHAVNLCEVFYDGLRRVGDVHTTGAMETLRRSGIIARYDMDDDFWREAGRLKAHQRRISLADCFAVVLARRLDSTLLTSDRHELEVVQRQGLCQVLFIR